MKTTENKLLAQSAVGTETTQKSGVSPKNLIKSRMNNLMSKYFFIVLFCLVSVVSFGQEGQEFKNIVSISPFRLWNGARIKYERPLNEKFTFGGLLTGYYGNYPGVQLAPIGRFYFKAHAPEGFYAQAKVVGAFHSRTVTVGTIEATILDGGEDRKQSFTSFGGGIALGYQLLFGKNDKWVIDLNLGAKFINLIPDPKLKEGEHVIDLDNAAWVLTGPGSIVDGLISIGFRF